MNIKYFLIGTFICFLACSGKEKNTTTSSDIIKHKIEVTNGNLKISDSLNCKIEIQQIRRTYRSIG